VYLKSITLKGFKSFASATELALEPGVTVIVGPNGSGKSNVVDAIAWVLGAQSPKAVRSTKMDDVIFAGTAKRAALGRAEVSLTIDNGSKILPIDFEEVKITRTLFRTGESEYAINDVGCRLLDIQELLSDSGVGRQQHVIISQGQIDAVLNARPEERRAIIEEAAGVLKFRRRREKSERRLKATEANLTRLQDLIREVRRQLKPLERQADAARRHGDLVDELTQLRVHQLGREVADLKDRIRRSTELKSTLREREGELKTSLRDLDTQVITAEAQLSAKGAGDVSDVLVRCESIRERLRGLDAVLAERLRGLDRERSSSVDGAVRSTLEAELEQATRELTDVEHRRAELNEEEEAIVAAEIAMETERKEFSTQWGDGVVELSDETPRVRGELSARNQARDQAMGERSKLAAMLEERRTKMQAFDVKADELRETLGGAEQRELDLVERLDAAAERHKNSDAALAAIVAQLETAIVDHQRWAARAEALQLALDATRADADELAAVEGVVGPLIDLVDVDSGFEQAFIAAVGSAAAAVVMADPEVARAAVDTLMEGDVSGAILALGAAETTAASGSPMAVTIGDPLRRHVRGTHPGVDSLLDRLVGDTACFNSWPEAIDAALAHPHIPIVTADGGSLTPSGWKVGSDRVGATGAALEEALAGVETGAAEVLRLTQDRDAAKGERDAVAGEEKRLQAELRQADDLTVSTSESLAAVQRNTRDTNVEMSGFESRIEELDERLAKDDARIAELTARLGQLEADEAQQLEQGQIMDTERRALEERSASVATRRSDLDVRASSLEEQSEFLSARVEDTKGRLERHVAAEEREDSSTWGVDERITVATSLRDHVATQLALVSEWLERVRAERQRQSEEVQAVARSLDALRKNRSQAERELIEVREKSSRSEIDDAEITVRLEAAVDTLRRELDTEPGVAMQTPPPPLPEGVKPAVRLRELERELRIMGPINPLALQEYEALSERFEFLSAQLEDVKASRRDLFKVIRAIDAEIVNVFTSAFADVSENFTHLFSTLFPGGTGRLKLTDPTNMLETGLEVEARPSGKNVRKLSLLSGGERSLTALAFLFAVFRSRPSPFYVMDEVEAALDDVNLHRFLELVAEFRNDAQLLIVSHQKRTMEAADCLYGVSMKPGESSVVVSERSAAADLVA